MQFVLILMRSGPGAIIRRFVLRVAHEVAFLLCNLALALLIFNSSSFHDFQLTAAGYFISNTVQYR